MHSYIKHKTILIMLNLQINCRAKLGFIKVGKHTGGKLLIHVAK